MGKFLVLFFVCVSLATASVSVYGQLRGSSRLDVAAFPIKCSVVGSIKLPTPCERTLLEFDIESRISISLTISGMVASIDSAIGIAGPEHLILQGKFNLGALTFTPEAWFAVPFETVSDVNNLPNIVVILPGDMLFVKERLTVQMNVGGVNVNNLLLFEDVNFPSPNADFGPAVYPAQSQSFGFGDILTISGQTVSGITLTSTTGVCATLSGRAVKKFSAPGGVNALCANQFVPLSFDFETLSLGGLVIANIPVGASISLSPENGLTIGTSFSQGLFDLAHLSTSFSFSTKNGFSAGSGLSIRLAADPLNVNLNFDQSFKFSGANVSTSVSQKLGLLRTNFSGSASLVPNQGLGSVIASLSLTQSLFSSTQSVSFSRQVVGVDTSGDPIFALGFSSLSINASIRLVPSTTRLSVTFGKVGLARLAIITGVAF